MLVLLPFLTLVNHVMQKWFPKVDELKKKAYFLNCIGRHIKQTKNRPLRALNY